MKEIYALILMLLLTSVKAQEIEIVQLLPPDSKELSDLNFLSEELQGKNVVMLGEYTHMYGDIFTMKARVIEYLHQELGFSTIAIESPMYDIWKMNATGFQPDEFNSAIWGVWGNNAEFQRLVNYIEKNNLKVIGFDSQIMNTSTFIEDFFDFCEENNIAFKLDEDDLGIILEGVLEDGTYESYDIKFNSFEKEFKSILGQIENLENTVRNEHWKFFTQNVLTAARDANTKVDPIIGAEMISKNQNSRDREMANNLLYYLGKNSTEKIVVWADNIHVMNNNSSIKKPIARDFISMGNYIKKELGEKVYSLATLHANDSLYYNGNWEPTPVLNGSFEAELGKKNMPYAFVSSNQEAMHKLYNTRLLSFEEFYEIRLDQVHDGYLFFSQASLPKKELDNITKVESNAYQEKKEISKVIEVDLVTLRGQIVDAGSNEPVAFANVILRDQEIYRVADENGYFDLTVNKSMFTNAAVSISSMGYEGMLIRLDELQGVTHLKPSYESLNEVLITAHLTPLSVLKKAVKNKFKNHTEEPFNYTRFSNTVLNQNDVTSLNLDVITKNYDRGFSSGKVTTKKVEQVRWNKDLLEGKVKFTNHIFPLREDAIRYSNILHKRKYKKFDLEFESSDLEENSGLYIIAFKTDRDKWNYTNRGYPTSYSGKIYIEKGTFAVIKVEENWKTNLNTDNIKDYYKGRRVYNGELSLIIKEENISYYHKKNDGKYYPSRYFHRIYRETEKEDGKNLNYVFEVNSNLYDYEFRDMEVIEYEFYGNENLTVLNRVEYDPDFWKNFNLYRFEKGS